MIEIYPDNKTSCPIGEPWNHSGTILGRLVMPITRYLRAKVALSEIDDMESLLDIGCGDCHFLLRSPCKFRIGIDLRFGDNVKDKLAFPDDSFTNVTLLAVIEHLEDPYAIIKESYRILKPHGKLIITTPQESGEFFMKLLKKDITDIHKRYFDKKSIEKLTENMFELVLNKKFLLGFNQLFVFKK